MDKLSLLGAWLPGILNWRAGIDILLITAGLFFVHRTLVRLGTWKIVMGILGAIFVFALANLLDLRGIRWIYSNLSGVAAIALIVIFQPELRKLLERMMSLRRREMGDEGADLAQMIGEAVFSLAGRKRGAILVLPGKEPIRESTSGGFSLNADPSLPLIASIFDPNSPGHDGALVIDSGRMTRFGVRLPISKTNALSNDYGTRHHAAMGLSEATDALVIVVSEERGRVTTFRQGQEGRVDDTDSLGAVIIDHMKITSSYTFEVQGWKQKKWVLAAEFGLSLLLAVVFWSTVILSQMEIREKGMAVPIEYKAIPENLTLSGEKPIEMKVFLGGPRSELDKIESSQLSVTMDLSKSSPGRQSLLITDENIRLPKGVRLLEARPAMLSLLLEEIVEIDLLVRAQLVGRLPPGLKLKSIEVEPRAVTVLSPASEGKGKDISLITTPIYLEGINEDARLFCKIIAPPGIKPKNKQWPDVEVRIEVMPK